ncbi:MAG: rRNA maturation RNase YbeY [Parvularculaceae bacterium]
MTPLAFPEDHAAIEVVVDDLRWLDALGDADAFAARCHAAARAAEARVRPGAALLLADDATLQRLNAQYRGKDKPTNVLAFPGAASPGDIAIAYETCAAEAGDDGPRFRNHAAHLIIHGLLHLAGHDHETDDDAERMEALETRILAALGIADPYASDDVAERG